MLRTATIRHFICWFSKDSDSFCRSEDEGAILVWSLTPFVTAGFLLQRWLFRFSRFPVFLIFPFFRFPGLFLRSFPRSSASLLSHVFRRFFSTVVQEVLSRTGGTPSLQLGFTLLGQLLSRRSLPGACPCACCSKAPLQISNVFTYSPLSTRVCLFLRACYWVRHSCDVAVCSLFLPRDCVNGCLHLRTKKRFCVNTCAGSLVL